MKIRPAAVAGMFYPADPVQLVQDVRAMLAATKDGALNLKR
ncbi:MAG: hypothetical protein WCP45_00280 [Verrucomicrobiota bacterium]